MLKLQDIALPEQHPRGDPRDEAEGDRYLAQRTGKPDTDPEEGDNGTDPIAGKIILVPALARLPGLTGQFAVRTVEQHRQHEYARPDIER